jgi:hypothetical protein
LSSWEYKYALPGPYRQKARILAVAIGNSEVGEAVGVSVGSGKGVFDGVGVSVAVGDGVADGDGVAARVLVGERDAGSVVAANTALSVDDELPLVSLHPVSVSTRKIGMRIKRKRINWAIPPIC